MAWAITDGVAATDRATLDARANPRRSIRQTFRQKAKKFVFKGLQVVMRWANRHNEMPTNVVFNTSPVYQMALLPMLRSSLFGRLVPVALLSITFGVGSLVWADWPSWRGPNQTGVADAGDYPIEWGSSDSIAWSTPIAGEGGSTPVVDAENVFITAGRDGKNHLLAFDLATGEPIWDVAIGEDRGKKNRKGSGSNPSVVIGDDVVYAYFRSGDLACVDLAGRVVWQTNLQDRYGEDTLWWDLGTSPVLTDEAVVVAVMQTGPSYLVAFDRVTGNVIWKQDRQLDAPEEAAQSYTTPITMTVDGREIIAVLGADHLTLHDADDGETLATLGGLNPTGHIYFRSIASPVVTASGIVLCPYARGESVTAVDARKLLAGEDQSAITWFRDDLGADVPTPAVVSVGDDRELAVFVADGKAARGTVTAIDPETGETVWSTRLAKSRADYSASPLIAGDHLYITREDATTFVIGPVGFDSPHNLATNRLDSDADVVASPVAVDGSILIRTRDALVRIGR